MHFNIAEGQCGLQGLSRAVRSSKIQGRQAVAVKNPSRPPWSQLIWMGQVEKMDAPQVIYDSISPQFFHKSFPTLLNGPGRYIFADRLNFAILSVRNSKGCWEKSFPWFPGIPGRPAFLASQPHMFRWPFRTMHLDGPGRYDECATIYYGPMLPFCFSKQRRVGEPPHILDRPPYILDSTGPARQCSWMGRVDMMDARQGRMDGLD